jgi:AcrR family transcriptional regulator
MTRRSSPRDPATKERIVRAAIETLKREGYAGTSARAIASTAGFSQAAVFYHFGTVHDLLIAALDSVSEDRMSRYSEAMQAVRGPSDLIAVARRVFAEDLAEGHTRVLVEMIVAASTDDDLGPRIVERIEPWIAMTAEALGRGTAGLPLASLLPTGEGAFAVVALFLGIELLSHLERDEGRASALFDTASTLFATFGPMLGAVAAGGPEGGPG